MEPPAKVAKTADNGAEATPLELMARRNKLMHSEPSIKAGRSFKTRPSDVFVATYPKCGTTWATQICHLLRSGGNMDFDEISVVCPWDIVALDCKVDLDAEQVANPRVFKSHERAGDIAKGGKYIHVCRKPEDAFISFYRFLPAWAAIPDGVISIEEFAQAILGGASHSDDIFHFFTEWWERRSDPDVLWVCYEDLKDDLPKQVKRTASFMEVPLTDELLAIVLERSSFKYMEARAKQFDEHFVWERLRDQMEIPKDFVFGDVPFSKVRAGGGKVGQGKSLPPDIAKILEDRWAASVCAKTGFKNYDEMRKAVAELSARS